MIFFITLNLDDKCFSLYFNLVSLLNKLFINFLINLKGKIVFFNKFDGKILSFKCDVI